MIKKLADLLLIVVAGAVLFVSGVEVRGVMTHAECPTVNAPITVPFGPEVRP